MSIYTVESAAKKVDRPDKGYGPMQIISLALKNGSGEITHAEWYTKSTTAVPAAGSQLDGDLTNGQFGWSFKKAQTGGMGGGGPRPEDPKRAAAIQRMHSQEMALRAIELAIHFDAVPLESNTIEDLLGLTRRVADLFDRDVDQAREVDGPPVQIKAPEVPVPVLSLSHEVLVDRIKALPATEAGKQMKHATKLKLLGMGVQDDSTPVAAVGALSEAQAVEVLTWIDEQEGKEEDGQEAG